MDDVRFGTGIDFAAGASGTTVVIDTFRAFTTAAVLFDRGIHRLMLTASLDEARHLAEQVDGLLCGEDGGRKPPDFELGNSPFEASRRTDLTGRTIVQRTSAGTRSVVAALDAGGDPVFAASFVVASATAAAVAATGSSAVTIVSAGLHGSEPSEEDDLTAAHIAGVLAGDVPRDTASAIASCARARELSVAPWAHPEDVAIAATQDRHAFAMRAVRSNDGMVEVRRIVTSD